MKGNDLINYNIKLVDAANHLKEQNYVILNRFNEYNKKHPHILKWIPLIILFVILFFLLKLKQ